MTIPWVYSWPLTAFAALLALSGAWLAAFPEREAAARRRTLSGRLRNNAAERLPSFPAAAERWCDPAAIRRSGMTRIGLGVGGIALMLPQLFGVYWP
ncbi:MAG TPA: hypothetical protein VM055_07270 [Novosphingobium sp.]|nr:hypothetical protein [Novosphingobium sp.]